MQTATQQNCREEARSSRGHANERHSAGCVGNRPTEQHAEVTAARPCSSLQATDDRDDKREPCTTRPGRMTSSRTKEPSDRQTDRRQARTPNSS